MTLLQLNEKMFLNRSKRRQDLKEPSAQLEPQAFMNEVTQQLSLSWRDGHNPFHVADQILWLAQQNPATAQELGFPQTREAILKEVVIPDFKENKTKTPPLESYVDSFKIYSCERPLAGLKGLDNTGRKSGPEIEDNPLYHEYLCTTDESATMFCSGQTSLEGTLFGPGTPSIDFYKVENCTLVKQDECETQCVTNTLLDPQRPYYGTKFIGENCQDYADSVLDECQTACATK